MVQFTDVDEEDATCAEVSGMWGGGWTRVEVR